MSNGFLKREPHTALKSAMGRPAMGVPKTPAVHNASTSRLHLPPHQQILTKTGEIKIPTTVTKMNTVSEQEPQQVTKQQVVRIRVNLIQLLSANLREQAQ